jgi:intracellular multiplication protein IcmJ
VPLLPISLSVWRKLDNGEATRAGRLRLKAQAETTLARDAYTCRCCGFKSEKFQRVIPADDDLGTDDPFITVCPFCELCFELDRAGLTGGGVLIWLPEMSQVELNHIVRALYAARGSDHPVAALADRTLDALMARRAEAKKRVGSDDPLLLATVMRESLNDKEYAQGKAKLDGIRLLPQNRFLTRGPKGDINLFPDMVAYWRSPQGPFGKLPFEAWIPLFKSVADKAGAVH